MEISTVIGAIGGLISVFVGMIIKGAPISSLNNPAAFLIIICGTFSCLFTAFNMKQLKSLPKIVKMVYFKPALHEKAELLSMFI